MVTKINGGSQRPPNARLQDEILVFLMGEDEIGTVAELARNLGAPRPSVSRAINVLASGGFVSKGGRGWFLTEPGVAEALRLQKLRSDRPEHYEMRPVIEALNSFANSTKDLERISEQIQFLASATEDAPQSPREEVRHLQLLFEGLTDTMEPLKELVERMQPVLSKFGSPAEGAELPELDAQDMQLLVQMARAYERAQWLAELVSGGMEALTSLIDKMQSAQGGEAPAKAGQSRDTLTPGAR